MDQDDEWIPPTTKLSIIEVIFSDDVILKNLKNYEKNIEFYDPIKDLKYEKWFTQTYGLVSIVLSCPKCFTVVCYNSTKEKEESFISSCTINTITGNTIEKNPSDDSIYLSVSCKYCMCNVGVYDPITKDYYFFNVLDGHG